MIAFAVQKVRQEALKGLTGKLEWSEIVNFVCEREIAAILVAFSLFRMAGYVESGMPCALRICKLKFENNVWNWRSPPHPRNWAKPKQTWQARDPQAWIRFGLLLLVILSSYLVQPEAAQQMAFLLILRPLVCLIFASAKSSCMSIKNPAVFVHHYLINGLTFSKIFTFKICLRVQYYLSCESVS